MYSSIMKGQRLGKEVLVSNNVLYVILYAFLFFFILEFSFHGFEIYTILKAIEKRNIENLSQKRQKNNAEIDIDIVLESPPKPVSHPPALHFSLQNQPNQAEFEQFSNVIKNQDMETSKILSPIGKKSKISENIHTENDVPSSKRKSRTSLRKASLSPKKGKNKGDPSHKYNFSSQSSPQKVMISPSNIKTSQILLNQQQHRPTLAKKILNMIPFTKTNKDDSKFGFPSPPNDILALADDFYEKREKEKKEALERFSIFRFSDEFSFIIDNPEDENCWQMTYQDRKLLNNKERENLKNELSADVMKASEKRIEYRKIANLQTFEGNKKVAYNGDDHDQKNFEFHLKKTTIMQDQKVSKRILSITLLGLILEIAFALLSFIYYYNTFMTSPESLLSILYASSVLEYLSCTLVLFLFTHEKSKEINNLRWISKDSQNYQNYVELQNRINFLSKTEPGYKN